MIRDSIRCFRLQGLGFSVSEFPGHARFVIFFLSIVVSVSVSMSDSPSEVKIMSVS